MPNFIEPDLSSTASRYSRPLIPAGPARGALSKVRVFRQSNQTSVSSETAVGGSDIERLIAAHHALWRIKSFPFRSEISQRLTVLRSACVDEGLPLAVSSVEQFVRFLSDHPNLPKPKLAITDRGNVRARWTPDKARHFAVEFAGNGSVHFVVIAPRPGQRPAHVSGTETEGNILSLASMLGVNWLA
ncbi:MAG TPA: hypothetical protein VF744_07510 [Beijerinckiaceae bacterium]|jgi:hypothetical protein